MWKLSSYKYSEPCLIIPQISNIQMELLDEWTALMDREILRAHFKSKHNPTDSVKTRGEELRVGKLVVFTGVFELAMDCGLVQWYN